MPPQPTTTTMLAAVSGAISKRGSTKISGYAAWQKKEGREGELSGAERSGEVEAARFLNLDWVGERASGMEARRQ